jgi:bifunctional oligoribonuclease and PAP phosphatase NrnA
VQGLSKAVNAIKKAKHIAISGHINPDGDSIGSMLALGLALQQLGKRVHMVSHDGVPARYRMLPGAGRIINNLRGPIDLAIAVDCGSKEMLGKTFSSFRRAADILEIDHHDFRRPFGTIAIIDKKAAAVGEIIFVLLGKLGIDITKPVAQNLMTSIIVETSSFSLPNTRPFTFEVCTNLIHKGVDFYRLVNMIFWSKHRAAAILSGVCLSRCRFVKGGRLVWSIIGMSDFKAAKGKSEDVDPVPDEMRSIDSVKIAVLFREIDSDTLRVSLRSKGRINVAEVAEHYNGGGHFDVAGCNIKNDPRAIQEFLGKVGRVLGR